MITKIYLIYGGMVGFFVSLIRDRLEDLLWTAILSVTGAVFAGLINYGWWLLKREQKGQKD